MTALARTPALIRSGLCSVTFRDLSARQIVDLVKQAGLDAIEWGMDVHLPPGDLENARKVRAMCEEAGIEIPSVGSYLRCEILEPEEFDAVLRTCQAVGAVTIRIWAGQVGSAECGSEQRRAIADTIQTYCQDAAKRGIELSLEYHQNTLTDTLASTLDLLREVSCKTLSTYWQPRAAGPIGPALKELDALKSDLGHLHVFHWENYQTRFALKDGEDYWRDIFAHLAANANPEPQTHRYAFLEFVRDDEPEQFLKDAKTLNELLGRAAA